MERVNNIFLRINKKVIITAGSVFLTLLIGLSFLKITVNIIYPGNDLEILIKESFKELFGKAVKFDTLYFNLDGDIVLLNFYLSNTTDFNDNINLIKCDEIIIDTDIIDLLRKKISISGIYMNDSEITIIKNNGKTYYEVLSDYFISGINKERLNTVLSDGLKIKINNSKGTYREVFRNGKTTLELEDLDIYVKYKDKILNYRINGDIRKKNKTFFSDSSFSAKGEIDTEILKSENYVSLSDFEIENLSEFLKENNIDTFTFKGELSADIDISCDNKFTRFNGSIELNDLECLKTLEKDSFRICNSEDIDLDFNFYVSDDRGIIRVENFIADDGVFRIKSDIDYKRDDILALNIYSNRINLDKLSGRVTPFRNCEYSGYLTFNTNMTYKLAEKKPQAISIAAKLEKFNLLPQNSKNNSQRSITDCNSQFILDMNKIDFKAKLKTEKTDIDFSLTSNLKGWEPFASDTSINLYSCRLEGCLLTGGIIAAIQYIYNEAFIDMFQNFDEQRNFLKEPEGIFISNNNIDLKIKADTLLITGNATLNNLNLDISLAKGMLRTTLFSLEGYSGKYSIDFYGMLKQDYPFIRFEGSVKDLDLEALSANAGLPYSLAGKLSLDYKFETNAYRVGQIIENGNASFNVSIESGGLTNHYIQKNIQSNLNLNGYNCGALDNIQFNSFSLGFMQSGDQFYIKNFSMQGATIGFSGYGRYYSDGDGINLPLNMIILSGNETIRVPLLIYGNLLAPCIKVNTKTARESVCF